jgi:hypothetical protein
MTPLEKIELYAWLGEDELGSGEIGIKQALVPAGLIPIVSIHRSKACSVTTEMETQAATWGRRIRLVRFVVAEVIYETRAGQ